VRDLVAAFRGMLACSVKYISNSPFSCGRWRRACTVWIQAHAICLDVAAAAVAFTVTMARSVCFIALMILASLCVASAQCIECKVSVVSQQQRGFCVARSLSEQQ
jgi:hypothetical protein